MRAIPWYTLLADIISFDKHQRHELALLVHHPHKNCPRRHVRRHVRLQVPVMDRLSRITSHLNHPHPAYHSRRPSLPIPTMNHLLMLPRLPLLILEWTWIGRMNQVPRTWLDGGLSSGQYRIRRCLNVLMRVLRLLPVHPHLLKSYLWRGSALANNVRSMEVHG